MTIRVVLEIPGGITTWESVLVEIADRPGAYILVKPGPAQAEAIRQALNANGELVVRVENVGRTL